MDIYMLIMDIHDSIVDINFGYGYLEFTTVVDIHNSVVETIMDIIFQLWISLLPIKIIYNTLMNYVYPWFFIKTES